MKRYMAGICFTVLLVASGVAHGDDHDTSQYVEFDGFDTRIHTTFSGAGFQRLDSVNDLAPGFALPGPDHGTAYGLVEHTWVLSQPRQHYTAPLAAVINVRWQPQNPNDHLSFGWWLADSPGSYFYDINPFVDGAEMRGALPDSISLPLRGEGEYTGKAHGFWQSAEEGSVTGYGIGDFEGEAILTADFAAGEIEGCVGCEDGITTRRHIYDLSQGALVFLDETSNLPIKFVMYPSSFISYLPRMGTFFGDMSIMHVDDGEAGVSVTDIWGPMADDAAGPDAPDAIDIGGTMRMPGQPGEGLPGHTFSYYRGWGTWEGRFSNRQDILWHPRSVAGTFRGHIGGNYNVNFDAAFIADSAGYREEMVVGGDPPEGE